MRYDVPAMTPSYESSVLENLFLPDGDEALTPEAARYVLTLGFGKNERNRFDQLSAKAGEGTLSDEERAKLEAYDRVRHLLIRLKSRARHALV